MCEWKILIPSDAPSRREISNAEIWKQNADSPPKFNTSGVIFALIVLLEN